jgi:hypothetical protein
MHGNVARANEVQHSQRVGRRQFHPDVAGDGGRRHQLDVRMRVGIGKGQRVVRPRVDIKNQRHG